MAALFFSWLVLSCCGPYIGCSDEVKKRQPRLRRYLNRPEASAFSLADEDTQHSSWHIRLASALDSRPLRAISSRRTFQGHLAQSRNPSVRPSQQIERHRRCPPANSSRAPRSRVANQESPNRKVDPGAPANSQSLCYAEFRYDLKRAAPRR